MNTQQILSRTFRINYNGGFALASNTEPLTWLINNNSGVQIVEAPNVEQAYFNACNHIPLNTAAHIYYRQWWQQHLPAVFNRA